MKRIILHTISLYKKLFFVLRYSRTPLFLYTDCKFYPSCSDYAIGAIKKYGTTKGLTKSLCRILKCSPFSAGGIDLP